MRYGVEQTIDPIRRAIIEGWFLGFVRPMFHGKVLPVSEDVMVRWQELVAEGRRRGRIYSQPDLIIAATALVHGLVLVTRNVKDSRSCQ